jgi:hypothetical protein
MIAGIFINADYSFAQQIHGEMHQKRIPYGDYCQGYKRGWYGARKAVKTPEQAREILQEYFSDSDVKIGEIREKRRFFRVEILDKNNNLTDIVIIDKRTGRIRSIYL